MTVFADQIEFMTRGSQTVDIFNPAQIELYASLISEEYHELDNAINHGEPLSHQIKEAIDVLVVVTGFLTSMGIDADEAWNIVYINNLLKVSEKVDYDANGKILKSEASKQRKVDMIQKLQDLVNAVV